jgi:hypothetical protein
MILEITTLQAFALYQGIDADSNVFDSFVSFKMSISETPVLTLMPQQKYHGGCEKRNPKMIESVIGTVGYVNR